MITPCLLVLLASLAAQPVPSELHGTVVDPSGAAVAGATVRAGSVQGVTDGRGRFVLVPAEPETLLHVSAPGFGDHIGRVTVPAFVRITLHPAGVIEALTVTASRSVERVADTSTATSVLAAPILLSAPTLTIDDALRTTPGFSLFRRSSSRVANPTTQGVNLRGLSASGASRALVLADGVPLNDPYGSWVYWDRIPLMAIDRIEVVRGGGSESLYGPRALAGTLQIVTIEPKAPTARVAVEGGQHGYARASAYAGARTSSWNGFAAAERLVFDGFPLVAPGERGTVDENAGVRYSSALIDGGRHGERLAVNARVNWLDENRANGTPLQRNDTNLWTAAVRGRAALASGTLAFAAFGGAVNYDQSFSSVAPGRAAETLTFRQRIASDHAGGSVQWAGTIGPAAWLVGGDAQRVSGGGAPADSGTQHDSAAFAHVTWQPAPRATLVAGGRFGAWSTTLADATGFDRRLWYFVPRVSFTWALSSDVALTGSWGNPARTPTLNELYRDFQVGNILTSANPHLGPEDARTVEGGIVARRGRASSRLVAFWTSVDDAIANVTIGTSGGRIMRQRRNAGRTRSRGLEAEGEWRWHPAAALVATVAWFDAVLVESVEPGLAGRRIPQVPRWQGSASLRLTPGRLVGTLEWRGFGRQFDDDRNQFVLRGANVVDGYVGVRVGGTQPFVALENVFAVEVDAGMTPVRTVGTPRSVRAGVRLFF